MLRSLLDIIADPFTEPLMVRALIEVLLIAIAGGALSGWIMLYRLSYSSEALSHTLLPGLVLAALIGLPLVVGGGAAILAGAAAIALARHLPAADVDASVATVTNTFLGGGALLALSAATPPGLHGMLFGDVLGVSRNDILMIAALTIILIVLLALLHHRLLAVGFDRTSARAAGLRPGLTDGVMLTLLAVALLIAVQGLGNLLVIAVLVAPGVALHRHVQRMPPLIGGAIIFAAICAISGLYLSFYAGLAAGASIVLVLVVAALLAQLVPVRPATGTRSR